MTNNKIDTEIKLRYPATDPHNTLESIGFRNGATWAFEEVKLALADKEKEIESLKQDLQNIYSSHEEWARKYLEKDLRIKTLEEENGNLKTRLDIINKSCEELLKPKP